jgi:hypothetical protein
VRLLDRSRDIAGDLPRVGSELLTPASPPQRLVVKQQQRLGGVAPETVGLDVRFEL